MDEDEYGSSVREARSRRKNIREHADEISKAQQMKLDSGAGLDYEREGEKVTGVAGEEEATFEETERDKFEPFNLRNEMEDGYFDQDGHYIWRRSAKEDAWEEELRDMEQTNGKKVIAKKTKTIVELEEEAPPATRGEVLEWKKTVVSCLLNNRDTVIRVLKLKNENFNRLTEAADNLMSAGYYDVYSDTKEKMAADIAKEETVMTARVAGVVRKRSGSPVRRDDDGSDSDERPSKRPHRTYSSRPSEADEPEGDSAGESE